LPDDDGCVILSSQQHWTYYKFMTVTRTLNKVV